jgi:hypothetical protein
MSGLARRSLSPTAGRHARLPGAAASSRGAASVADIVGVRGICLVALIALVVQFGLGMILNLYARQASSVTLTVHSLLGVVLIGAAIALLLRVRGGGNRVLTGFAATGLIAILGAFAAGEIFVRDRQTGASLCMAILTGVALACYIGALNLMRVVPRQPAPVPDLATLPGQRPSPSGPPAWIRPGFATGPQPSSAPVPADVGLPPWGDRAGAPPRLPARKPFTGDFPKATK